jgi:hypothetical protein
MGHIRQIVQPTFREDMRARVAAHDVIIEAGPSNSVTWVRSATGETVEIRELLWNGIPIPKLS